MNPVSDPSYFVGRRDYLAVMLDHLGEMAKHEQRHGNNRTRMLVKSLREMTRLNLKSTKRTIAALERVNG